MEVTSFSGGQLVAAAGQRGADFDAVITGWVLDFPDPFDTLDVLLNGNNIRDSGNTNLSYFNDASIGTNAKSYRQIETLWSYNDSWTNLPERAQAGVIHFGFGAEHWDQTFLAYAKANKLPTMHFPHVHNLFATYEIRQRDTGEWVKLIDKGRLTALDHPRVVRLAESLGGAHHLEYDWIPAVPGINFPGDYHRDYGPDPAAWIRREQTGEFAHA